MTNDIPGELAYLWVDLELTGLDTELDRIIEFGVIGTTQDLDVLFRRTITVRATRASIARIRSIPPVLAMHTANGLLDELTGPDADSLPTVRDAEVELLQVIDSYTAGTVILAGSGVWHCDLRFLRHHTPELAARFDVREILDVGTNRRAYRRATGRDLTEANTGKNHRADVDIQCSLDEGRAYFELYRANERVPA